MSAHSTFSLSFPSDPRRWRPLAGVAVAFASTAAALAVTLLLRGSENHPSLFLFSASILLSTWIGGWRPGFLAAALTLLSGAYFLLEPIGSILIHDQIHLIQIAFGSLVLIAIAVGFERNPSPDDLSSWLAKMGRIVARTPNFESPPPTPYDIFASVYGRHFGVETRKRLLPIHEELMLRHLPPDAHVLDLCCGSGDLAEALVQRGFRVVGIDNSAEMLRLARAKAPSASFLLADARFFQLPHIHSGVLCTFNSLAHIHRRSDLESTFRNVHRALVPGGYFLFDVFLEEAYLRRWCGNFSIVDNGQVCVVNSSYDPAQRLGRNDITVFEHGREWKRADLTLLQKCHHQDEIRESLALCGFKDICEYDGARDFDLPNEQGRAFFLCRRSH